MRSNINIFLKIKGGLNLYYVKCDMRWDLFGLDLVIGGWGEKEKEWLVIKGYGGIRKIFRNRYVSFEVKFYFLSCWLLISLF